jgi:hypothetical protein
MKTPTFKPKFTGRYESAPAIHTPQLPGNFELIQKRAQKIYAVRGGMMRMTLNDWLKAELQLKQQLGGQTN